MEAPDIAARVKAAAAARTPLAIRGSGSKAFYGAPPRGEPLDVAGHRGIVDYQPRELVLVVRAGTPLAEVEAALDAEDQMLAFEPPRFGGGGTVGGMVAAGLSGPRRPYAGAVRDFVLGARIVDGQGQVLTFGGRVIKNVAGYDVSRLMAGAMGTLGVLLEVSFKVLPKPVAEATLRFELSAADAVARFNDWAGKPLPLSAAAWADGVATIRLSGTAAGVKAARAQLGGQPVEGAWQGWRDQSSAFFAGEAPLWRVSLPPASGWQAEAPGVIEWGGGLRWLRGARDAAALRREVEGAGGHVTLFRGGDKSAGVFHPLTPVIARIHANLKAAFDPHGILNPGRLDNI